MSPWISPAPLAGLDVTPGQVGVLPVIAAGPGLSQTALGRALRLSAAGEKTLAEIERRVPAHERRIARPASRRRGASS